MNDQHTKLLSATALGDRQAFERLYQSTSGHLHAIGLQMLKDETLAEDVLQDAYIKIWHNAAEYRNNRGSVLNWMISIIRYRALDMLRSQKSRSQNHQHYIKDQESLMNVGEDPAVVLSKDRKRIELDDCLEELEKSQADAISLAFYKGYTHREICQHMLSPLGTVKSWIRRGLQHLKWCLER